MTVFAGGRVITDQGLIERGWVETDGAVIVGCGDGDAPGAPDFDLDGRLLVPGFIDQHCHGGGGHSFMTTDPGEAASVAEFHLRHGTTSLMASLVSGSNEALKGQIAAISPLVDSGTLLAIHLEGPWINTHRCGAQDPRQLRPPDPAEVAELLDLAGGRIRMITIAPELPGAIPAIQQIVSAEVIAAIGHTDADFETAMAGIDAGATVATHLSNAMRPLHHREPGALGALLEDPRVFIELIADGVHLHPATIRLFRNHAGNDRSVLITDAMGAAGSPDGRYLLGDLEVEVAGGVARLVEGGAIAGSTLTLDAALRFVVSEVGLGIEDAIGMLTANPARALGLPDRGVISPGKRADLVVLDSELEVEAVMVAGDLRFHAI